MSDTARYLDRPIEGRFYAGFNLDEWVEIEDAALSEHDWDCVCEALFAIAEIRLGRGYDEYH